MRKWIVNTALFAMISVGGAAAARATGPHHPPECGTRGSFFSLEVIGLTSDQRLICFREQVPFAARDIAPVTGLLNGETLLGIDFRPSNGTLYGLGSAGGVYTIDPRTAVATQVSVLSQALAGTSFGVDFNPVPDRLRIVSDTGQNLRVNVDTGAAIVDGALNPAPGTGVTGVAYTNNDADLETATVLYDIETTADRLSIQAPPNAGTLNPVGTLRVDAGTDVGFDIYSDLEDGSTERLKALASLDVLGKLRLYHVDLATGKTELRGVFAARNRVIGIAIPPGQ
jgi:hypothetical protein